MQPYHKGIAYEDFAVDELCRSGWEILDRNFRSPWGEVDIVALKDKKLRFIEVRQRQNGNAFESVDSAKQRRIARTSMFWLHRHSVEFDECAFMVCAIDGTGLDWIENAFDHFED